MPRDNPVFEFESHYVIFKHVRFNVDFGCFAAGTTFWSMRVDLDTRRVVIDPRPVQMLVIEQRPGDVIDWNAKHYAYTGVRVKQFLAGLRPGQKVAGLYMKENDVAFWWDEGEWWTGGGDLRFFNKKLLVRAMHVPVDDEMPVAPMT